MNNLSAPARMAIFLTAAIIVPAFAAGSPKTPKKEKNSMEWSGAFSPIDEPEHAVIKTEDEWKALWQKLGKPAPAADFKKHFAVAVFLGQKPTGGYGVSWEGAGSSIRYKVKKPAGMAIEALTQPFAIKLFEKSGNMTDVKVEAAHD